ncbi:MAG: response regulator, partial [Gammaproteobacteria bacterium]|nr:response regulator [Gammaproteobacteria bacterium]
MTTIPADEKVRLLAEDARPFVLVVDDDAALRRYACNAMHGCGIDVAEAATGREAIQAISEQEFDCVLLDISMPGLDGFQTCTEVRRRRDNDPLPIVVITGCDDPHSIERAYHSGATDFVTKPINWPILEQRIRHLSLAYRTARHLEHSEDNRRALLEAVPDTVLRTDSTG